VGQLQGGTRDKEQDSRRSAHVEHDRKDEAHPEPFADAVNGMQRAVGNQAVQRLLSSAASELNAALTADENGLGDDIRARSGSGSQLPSGVQRKLESGLGADLSNVRVHTDGAADRLARSVQAQAFTSGSDIFFRSGAYQPGSAAGTRLLAHEAAHTVQQAAGPVDGTPSGGGVSISHPSDRFEQAAEQVAARVASGASVAARPHSGSSRAGALQRLMVQRGLLDEASSWPDKVRAWDKVHHLAKVLEVFASASSPAAQLEALEGLPGRIATVRGNIPAAGLGQFAAKRVNDMLTTLESEIPGHRDKIANSAPSGGRGVTPRTAGAPSKPPPSRPDAVLESSPTRIVPPKSSVVPDVQLPAIEKPLAPTGKPPSRPSPALEKPPEKAPDPLPEPEKAPEKLRSPLRKPPLVPLTSTIEESPPEKPVVPWAKRTLKPLTSTVVESPPERPAEPSRPAPSRTRGAMFGSPKASSTSVLEKPPSQPAVITSGPTTETEPKSSPSIAPAKVPAKSEPESAVVEVTPTPVVVPPVVAEPNPALIPKDEAERGTIRTRIAKGAHYLSATSDTWWTADNPRTGDAPSPAAAYDKQIRNGAKYESTDRGTEYTAHAASLVRTVGPWGFNREILAGRPYRLGTTEFTTNAARVATFVRDDGGDAILTLQDGRTVRTATANTRTINFIQVRRSDNTLVIVKAEDLSTATVVTAKVDNKFVLVRESDISLAQTGFKALEPAQKLFPDGGPKPEHIHQTGLGDCYLQSVLISIANKNPKHFERMMPDTPGQKTVTVNFYNVISRSGAVSYEAVPITIEKSLPESAAGTALYNEGANWARLIEKAFAVFAGKHGKYGEAYRAEAPATAGGYADIAGGVEYQLYGVFYGPGVTAPVSRTQTTHSAADGDAANLLANQGAIEKLLQFKGQGISSDEVVNLTASATLLAHLQRAKGALDVCAAGLEGVGIKNMVWLKQELGKAILQEQDPVIKKKPLEQKASVKEVVDAAREALGGVYGTLVATIKANPNNAAMQTLHEMLLNLLNAGTDSSTGQRFIYSGHAYAIVGVAFKKANGTAFTPRVDRLTDDLNEISASKSEVTLRNPHHGNAPNPTGAPETSEGPTAGQFTLSLAQYLRNFSMLDYGRVKATK
jgi:hypothetical protein